MKKEKPQIVLLQETTVIGENIEEILRKMKPRFEAVALDAKGSIGGLLDRNDENFDLKIS